MSIVPVDRSNNWYLRYYFAEPDPRVKKGERVFNVLLGSGSAFNAIGTSPEGFDILSKSPVLSAMTVPVFFNFSDYAQVSVFSVQCIPVQYSFCTVRFFCTIQFLCSTIPA